MVLKGQPTAENGQPTTENSQQNPQKTVFSHSLVDTRCIPPDLKSEDVLPSIFKVEYGLHLGLVLLLTFSRMLYWGYPMCFRWETGWQTVRKKCVLNFTNIHMCGYINKNTGPLKWMRRCEDSVTGQLYWGGWTVKREITKMWSVITNWGKISVIWWLFCAYDYPCMLYTLIYVN